MPNTYMWSDRQANTPSTGQPHTQRHMDTRTQDFQFIKIQSQHVAIRRFPCQPNTDSRMSPWLCPWHPIVNNKGTGKTIWKKITITYSPHFLIPNKYHLTWHASTQTVYLSTAIGSCYSTNYSSVLLGGQPPFEVGICTGDGVGECYKGAEVASKKFHRIPRISYGRRPI